MLNDDEDYDDEKEIRGKAAKSKSRKGFSSWLKRHSKKSDPDEDFEDQYDDTEEQGNNVLENTNIDVPDDGGQRPQSPETNHVRNTIESIKDGLVRIFMPPEPDDEDEDN